MIKYLKQLPIQLIISIVASLILGQVLGELIISIFYTISSCLIQVLLFILPIMVFGFIFKALVNIKHGSFLLIALIFVGVTLSNCIALTVAYLFGKTFLPFLGLTFSSDFATNFSSKIVPFVTFNLMPIIKTEKALLLGIISGCMINVLNESNPLKKLGTIGAMYLVEAVSFFLQKIFIPLLPLYVFGFCLKLSYDKVLITLFEQYGKVFFLSMILVVAYICILYILGAAGNLKKAKKDMKAMLPAGLTAFSTMSSAATMPVTLQCTEKTTKDPDLSNLIIPSTANIHMLGDDLTIVITAMSLLSIFGLPWPSPVQFLPFCLSFSIAKLSCVGVPGASVLVILPVLQQHLGFTPVMISILTTIYTLQDSFGTAANVMGNGAFALIIQRILACIRKLCYIKNTQ